MIKTHYIRSIELLTESITDRSEYPFNLPVIRFLEEIERLEFHENVTFLVGENGTGKSTLLESVAVQYGFNPEGGSKNFNFSTHATHSVLEKHIRLAKGFSHPKDGYFLRAESFYNVASSIDAIQKDE